MFQRGKLVTSSVRAAAIAAGAVILAPFLAFADSVPILPDPPPIVLTPGAPLNLTEGPAITPFTVMVMNTTTNLITLDGIAIHVPNIDLSDKLFVTRVGDNCPIAGLPGGAVCTIDFNVTTSNDGDSGELVDIGSAMVVFTLTTGAGKAVSPAVKFTVTDVPKATPEPATLTLFAAGALGLAVLGRLHRGKRKTS
jgi:PEP-CTERM motif